jgi:hypothetical protein
MASNRTQVGQLIPLEFVHANYLGSQVLARVRQFISLATITPSLVTVGDANFLPNPAMRQFVVVI